MTRRADRLVTVAATLLTLAVIGLVARDNWPIDWAALTGTQLVALGAPVLVVVTIWCWYVERRRTDRAYARYEHLRETVTLQRERVAKTLSRGAFR